MPEIIQRMFTVHFPSVALTAAITSSLESRQTSIN